MTELCIMNHTIRGRHDPDCLTMTLPADIAPDCEGCAPAEARYGHLCGKCFGRTRFLLGQTPDLIAHILPQVIPSTAIATGERVSGGGFKAPLPLQAQPLEDANDLYAQLMNWMISHARSNGLRPPVLALGYARLDDDARGLPSWSTPATARDYVQSLVDWYGKHELVIAGGPPASVQAWVDDLGEMLRTLNGRYPQAPRRKDSAAHRPCPTCDMREVRVRWYGDEAQVVCDNCMQVIDPAAAGKYFDWLGNGAGWCMSVEKTIVAGKPYVLSCELEAGHRGKHQDNTATGYPREWAAA